MAINIKQIVADAMLDLCRTKELKAITIKDIREKTGISRQGFYNHFKDKDDLIHWIYYDRVLTNFHNTDTDKGYYENPERLFPAGGEVSLLSEARCYDVRAELPEKLYAGASL